VGEHTALSAPGFAFLEADLIRVIGKQNPERVFALVAMKLWRRIMGSRP